MSNYQHGYGGGYQQDSQGGYGNGNGGYPQGPQHGYGGEYPQDNQSNYGGPQQYPPQQYSSQQYPGQHAYPPQDNQGYPHDQQQQYAGQHDATSPYPSEKEFAHQGQQNHSGEFNPEDGEDGDRGLKDVFYKQSIDQYGQEHSDFRTGRALLATAVLGAAVFGVKKAMDKKKEKELSQQQEEIGGGATTAYPSEMYTQPPPLDNKSHYSGYGGGYTGYNSYGYTGPSNNGPYGGAN